jgi:hypothetical protein
MQDADDTVVILPYKPIASEETENGIVIEANKIIKSPDKLPSTVTALGKYIFRGRPISKGGTVYCIIRLSYDGDRETMLVYTEYEFRDNEIRLFIQSLQHHDSKMVGWLHFFNPECDIQYWSEWFSKALKEKNISSSGIGLKSKFCFTGVKYNKNAPNKSTRAIHLEVVRQEAEKIIPAFKNILRSTEFRKVYGTQVRLVPAFDRNNSPSVNNKIQRLILQHKNAMMCLSKKTIYYIDCLDSVESTTKLSM